MNVRADMEPPELTLERFAVRCWSDETVLSRAIAGEPIAFSEAYSRWRPRVYGYCLARLMSPEAAADATQEVFLRVLRSPSDDVDNPVSWLFSIARNVVVDSIRARDRAPRAVDAADMSDDFFGSTERDAADDHVMRREETRSVLIAMRRLRPRYREVIALRDVQGLSSAQTAERMASTPGAVDTMLCRARTALAVGYGKVADLPPACLEAFEAIDPGPGTAVDGARAQALQVHLEGCPRCRKEAARVERGRGVGALLAMPFLSRSGCSAALSRAGLVSYDPVMRVAIAGVLAAVLVVPAGAVITARVAAGAATTRPAHVARISALVPRPVPPARRDAFAAAAGSREPSGTVTAARADGPARGSASGAGPSGSRSGEPDPPASSRRSEGSPGGRPSAGPGPAEPARSPSGTGGDAGSGGASGSGGAGSAGDKGSGD